MADPVRFLLLVNPSAGGGRAAGVLEGAKTALDELGATYRIVTTRSIEHGVQEARAGATAGEVPTVISGDGLILAFDDGGDNLVPSDLNGQADIFVTRIPRTDCP